jgi:exosortase/archaeosortase family protein
MKASGYLLVVLLIFAIVGMPVAVRLYWDTLGPHWAAAVAFFIPGAHAAGNHVITPAVDVRVNHQCSGFENIQIFSMLFATVFVMNWKRMQAWRCVLLYLSALAALTVVNLARIINIVVHAKETQYGLSNTLALILLIVLVWKVKWLRPATSSPASSNS